MGDVLGDLNGRRGPRPRHQGLAGAHGDDRCVDSAGNCLRLCDGSAKRDAGRGTYTMEPSHYAEVPEDIARTMVSGGYSVRVALTHQRPNRGLRERWARRS